MSFYYIPTKIIVNKIRTDSQSRQSEEPTTKFLLLKNIVRPISNVNDEISLMMNGRTE